MKVLSASRSVKVLLFVLLALGFAAVFVSPYTEFYWEWHMEGKAKIREGGVRESAIHSSPVQPASVLLAPSGGFTPQTRLGFHVNNEWEPAIASDRFGHVYVLY